MTNYLNIQKKYYSQEWKKLVLANKPGMTGWRTSIPNKEVFEFINFLKDCGIKKGRVLDLGCGGGRYAIAYAKNGFEVYGIDFIPEAIKKAQYNVDKVGLGSKVHLQVGDILKLSYPKDYFDIINDDGCFHHIAKKDWATYKKNLKNFLKSGGYCRLKVFSAKSKSYKESKNDSKSHWIKKTSENYTYFFTPKELTELFTKDFDLVYLKEKQHEINKNNIFIFCVVRKK